MREETSKRRAFDYTEAEMADVFQQFMQEQKGLPGIGRFSRVFREIDCQQGRPDFIALSRTQRRFLNGNTISVKLSGSLVLSLLHDKAGRTADYISRQSGLSVRSVQSALAELLAHKYVKRNANDAYSINASRSLREIKVIAIELKLDRPRRALFQAQQARSFAQQVLIVVPPSQAKLYIKYAVALRRWGIGLATFDPKTRDFALCRTPRTARPRSKQHQAYAMFQLLADSKA